MFPFEARCPPIKPCDERTGDFWVLWDQVIIVAGFCDILYWLSQLLQQISCFFLGLFILQMAQVLLWAPIPISLAFQ
jgi:hypothetical protein